MLCPVSPEQLAPPWLQSGWPSRGDAVMLCKPCTALLIPHSFLLTIFSFPIHRSSQRKCSLGKPDQKELSDNLAATQGLAHMITECNRLFQVRCWMLHCKSIGRVLLPWAWGQLGVCAVEGCPIPTGARPDPPILRELARDDTLCWNRGCSDSHACVWPQPLISSPLICIWIFPQTDFPA